MIVNVPRLFLTVPCVGLQYVSVVFPEHLLFFNLCTSRELIFLSDEMGL